MHTQSSLLAPVDQDVLPISIIQIQLTPEQLAELPQLHADTPAGVLAGESAGRRFHIEVLSVLAVGPHSDPIDAPTSYDLDGEEIPGDLAQKMHARELPRGVRALRYEVHYPGPDPWGWCVVRYEGDPLLSLGAWWSRLGRMDHWQVDDVLWRLGLPWYTPGARLGLPMGAPAGVFALCSLYERAARGDA